MNCKCALLLLSLGSCGGTLFGKRDTGTFSPQAASKYDPNLFLPGLNPAILPQGWTKTDDSHLVVTFGDDGQTSTDPVNVDMGSIDSGILVGQSIQLKNLSSRSLGSASINDRSDGADVYLCSCAAGEPLQLGSLDPNTCLQVNVILKTDTPGNKVGSIAIEGLLNYSVKANVQAAANSSTGFTLSKTPKDLIIGSCEKL